MHFLPPHNALIVFSSKGNSARSIALRIHANLGNTAEILCLNDSFILAEELDFKHLILVCPTYGDEEMERTMENFLVHSEWGKHGGKKFAVAELGLYRGYIETEQGAGIIIRNYLSSKNLVFCGAMLSVDSIPLEDFSLIDQWSKKLAQF
jgi:flavodoxin